MHTRFSKRVEAKSGLSASSDTDNNLCKFAIQVYKVFFRTMYQHLAIKGFKFILLLKQYFLYVWNFHISLSVFIVYVQI